MGCGSKLLRFVVAWNGWPQEVSRYSCPGRVVSVLEGGYGKYERVKPEGAADSEPSFALNVRAGVTVAVL